MRFTPIGGRSRPRSRNKGGRGQFHRENYCRRGDRGSRWAGVGGNGGVPLPREGSAAGRAAHALV